MMKKIKKIGLKLKKAREYLSLTQEQVASIIGCGRDAIIRIENDNRKVTADELYSFSKIYGISVDELINDEYNVNYSHQVLARGFDSLTEKDQQEILNLIKFKNEYK
jgi:transcriptional regulator with XRE-family HTH domain